MTFKIGKRIHEHYALVDFLDNISFINVFFLWLLLIVLFGLVFFSLAFTQDGSLVYRGENIGGDETGLVNSLYFSFVTATSLGYGDLVPIGISKFLSGIEVILGLIIYGILISKLVGVRQKVILEEVYDISFDDVVDRLRSALYLFRSDINRFLEKVDSESVKQREIKDLWMIISGLDMTLTDIKKIIIPPKSSDHYHKVIDSFRLELLLNSMQLSLDKVLELLTSLKVQDIKWKNDLLMKSVSEVNIIVNEIIEYQSKLSHEKKVGDKLEELKKTVDNIESELKSEHKKIETKKEK